MNELAMTSDIVQDFLPVDAIAERSS